MSLKKLLLSGMSVVASLALQAQVDPRLKTTTDLADVYKRSSGDSAMVAIYDTTPNSRGMFESVGYLTRGSHASWTKVSTNQESAGNLVDSTINALFAPDGKDFGYVFGFQQGSDGRVEVRLYPWPTCFTSGSPAALKQSGSDIIGRPVYTDALGVVREAYWNTDLATTLATPKDSSGTVVAYPVSHVRVTLASATSGLQAGMPGRRDLGPALASTGLPDSRHPLLGMSLATSAIANANNPNTTITGVSTSCAIPGSTVTLTGTDLYDAAFTITVTLYQSDGTTSLGTCTVNSGSSSLNSLSVTLPAIMAGNRYYVGPAIFKVAVSRTSPTKSSTGTSASNLFMVGGQGTPSVSNWGPQTATTGATQVVTFGGDYSSTLGAYLNGANITSGSYGVRVNGIAATGITVSGGTGTNTGTGITCTFPSFAVAGSYPVTITTPCGNAFTVGSYVVSGGGGGDTTAPTVSAAVVGTSGTITFNASASDNVGVTNVQWFIDGSATAAVSDATNPYSISYDSTLLANGTHTLVAKAYDAAGNVGTSSTVNFSVNNSGGGGGSAPAGRTIDLPCPWKLLDSPHAADSGNPRKAAAYDASTNPYPPSSFSRGTTTFNGSNVSYDTWSPSHVASLGVVSHGTVTSTIVGHFFYPSDYLAWIFGGKGVRNADSSDWLSISTSSSTINTIYGSGNPYTGNTGNFAVPNAVKSDGTDYKPGYRNGLPTMTRYQAEKTTSINVFLDQFGQVIWVYRFLDPAIPGIDKGEELQRLDGTAVDATSNLTPASDAATDETNLKDLRVLAFDDLIASKAALQKAGPATWDYKNYPFDMNGTSGRMDTMDNGNRFTVDPRNPMPVSQALANTYRQIKANSSLFGSTGSAGCPGRIYVVLFPSTAMGDSYSDPLDYVSAYKYMGYYNGNSGLMAGSPKQSEYTASGLAPGNETFHPGVLASAAAWGTAAPNSKYWGAPWNSTAGTPAKIQTMVVSLGIPGLLKAGAENNGANAHEQYFAVAQWANPWRTSHVGVSGEWAAANGGEHDYSVVDPTHANGQVHYYPSSDPQSLEQNLTTLLSYIVAAKASLSAPATPATGIRNASQAYFGTFATSTSTTGTNAVPLWSGNLYAIGLARGTDGSFTFYGKGGTTIANSGSSNTAVADFDANNLWSAYKIFGNYSTLPNGATPRPATDSTVVLGGAGLSWKDRKLYFVYNDALTLFDLTNNSHLAAIASGVAASDGGSGYLSKDITARSSHAITTAEAATLMRFLMGAYDETNTNTASATYGLNRDKYDVNSQGASAGHVNIMGDIINSAPLAIELSKDLADKFVTSSRFGASDKAFYDDVWDTSKYDDPHARLLVVGTNTGHLHCFLEVAGKKKTTVGSTTTTDAFVTSKATELWAFMPNVLLPMLWDVYVNRANAATDSTGYAHRYGIDGDPQLYWQDLATKDSTGAAIAPPDTRVSNKEDAVIIFGFRKGARDYYALTISNAAGTVDPSGPSLAWHIDPLNEKYGAGAGTVDTTHIIRRMGMSTSVPTVATILDGSGNRKRVVFLTGGYSNSEVDLNFGRRLGRSVLCLDPLTGAPPSGIAINKWDFTGTTVTSSGVTAEVGAIASGVSAIPVINRASGLAQRLYFADFFGGIWCINSSSTTSIGLRLDNPDITTWNTTPRLIFSSPDERFTTTPDAARLEGDYPVAVDVPGTTPTQQARLLTVMVSVGSGDRNNPVDSLEGASADVKPSPYDRLYVLADRQDLTTLTSSDVVGIGSNGKQVGSPSTTWPSCYNSSIFDVTSGSYLWKNYRGYYFALGDGSHPNAYNNLTHDKVLVSPLSKDGSLFYSFFNISGNNGFDCSAFATTRTFRQCDVLRPLYFDPQVSITDTTQKVGDSTDLTKNYDTCNSTNACSGLAFTFNSLSSQLVDSGDYILQGGAKANTSITNTSSTGMNTPDIQSVKNTGKTKGFRIRAWRIVR